MNNLLVYGTTTKTKQTKWGYYELLKVPSLNKKYMNYNLGILTYYCIMYLIISVNYTHS